MSSSNALVVDTSSREACRSAFASRMGVATRSRERRVSVTWCSLAVLASASLLRLAMMSSAVMSRIAAWSVELRVDHIGARKEKGAELDGGARESVAVPAAANAVPGDGVAGIL